jgi:hypothetical protein
MSQTTPPSDDRPATVATAMSAEDARRSRVEYGFPERIEDPAAPPIFDTRQNLARNRVGSYRSMDPGLTTQGDFPDRATFSTRFHTPGAPRLRALVALDVVTDGKR